jgi:hypothetical protein
MVRRGPAGSSSPWTVGRRDGRASRMLELQPSCWRPSEAPPFHPAARHDSRFTRRCRPWRRRRRSSRDFAGGGFGRRSAIPSMGATLVGGGRAGAALDGAEEQRRHGRFIVRRCAGGAVPRERLRAGRAAGRRDGRAASGVAWGGLGPEIGCGGGAGAWRKKGKGGIERGMRGDSSGPSRVWVDLFYYSTSFLFSGEERAAAAWVRWYGVGSMMWHHARDRHDLPVASPDTTWTFVFFLIVHHVPIYNQGNTTRTNLSESPRIDRQPGRRFSHQTKAS